MPKNKRHTRGEIIAALQRYALISPQDLEDALSSVGVEEPGVVKSYIKKLEEGALIRTAGGWKLSKESRKTGTISLKITPAAHASDVIRAIDPVIRQFGKIVTIEVEA